VTLAVTGLTALQAAQAPAASARSSFTAPFMGWSSWSNEASTHPNYGTGWLTEQNIKNAADALNIKLKAAGYNHVDIDAGWDADTGWNFHTDGNGIPNPDPGRFPDGISGVASYVHNEGLFLGIYGAVGMAKFVYDNNYPIAGTGCHTQDIAVKPLTATNKWGTAWKIDYTNPCAQSYIDSIVAKYASWGIDLIKIDGVTPDNVPDAKAWSAAIDHSGRKMWLTASAWPVDIAAADGLSPYVNGARVDTDIECYCDTVSTWTQSVGDRWNDLPDWLSHVNGSFRPDLDSMPINNNTGTGLQDGISDTERQSVFNFWSMASSPLYVGGDIYFMDSKAISILSNPEVIAVDQSSVNPVQVVSGTTQVWKKTVGADTYAAVYNLGTSPANITVNWSQLGLSGSATVRDVDARSSLGTFTGSWTANGVPAHGSRLIKISGASTSGVTSYEAEAGHLGGAAVVYGCASCSGGAKVGYLGNGAANDLTLTVTATTAGPKTLTIWYLVGGSRPLALSVNGGADQTSTLSGSDWNYPVSTTTRVTLAAGSNTLRFHDDTAYAPDLDRVTVG
jgi:hypothetical protein